MNKIEVCLTLENYPNFKNPNAAVIVVDVLRATSSICAAFVNGVNQIVPVPDFADAWAYKEKGFLVASEKDGMKRPEADFGNSPQNFSAENISGRNLVYCTTNGTRAIHAATESKGVAIGSFLNLTAVTEWAMDKNCDILVLCSGWKGKFNIEDTLFAGAVCELALKNPNYSTICDSALAAIDLWDIAKNNLPEYIKKVAQYTRLNKNGNGDSIPYCIEIDTTKEVPIFDGKTIRAATKNEI